MPMPLWNPVSPLARSRSSRSGSGIPGAGVGLGQRVESMARPVVRRKACARTETVLEDLFKGVMSHEYEGSGSQRGRVAGTV
jgi:hypothetical protein